MNDIARRQPLPPGMPPDPPARPRPLRAGPFGVLDIGTSKVVCLIGRVDGDGQLRVLGVGHTQSRGVRAGSIIDLEAAEACIRAAVGDAVVRVSRAAGIVAWVAPGLCSEPSTVLVGRGSGMTWRPPVLLALCSSCSTQMRLMAGFLLPENLNWMGTAGCSQTVERPLPS